MIVLSREIRFSLARPETERPMNSWAAWPATDAIAPFLKLRCEITGNPDPATGYLCNIKVIDNLLREIVLDKLVEDYQPGLSATALIRKVRDEVVANWNPSQSNGAEILSVTLDATPFLKFKIQSDDPAMIQMTQQFEFSASHRLHCAHLSDDENRALFGKCNNPAGHGHNYVVDVTVAGGGDDERTPSLIHLSELEQTVKRLVIDRLDHKHLNVDVDYFSDVNPSVENICIAVYRWLDGQFGDSRLETVRVYETPKTWAEYSGG